MAVPNTLVIAAADAGSGSATVTVSGAAPGDVVTVSYSRWVPKVGYRASVPGGSATANGSGVATVTVATGFGLVLLSALSAATGSPNAANNTAGLYYLAVVDPTAKSVWEQCCDAVGTFVQSLNLSGMDPDNVLVSWFPAMKRTVLPSLPACVVSPLGAESYQGTMSQTDDMGLPVIVVLFDKTDHSTRVNMTRVMLWRQQVQRAFRFQRLTGVPGIINCTISPDVLLNPDAYNTNNLAVSAMVFNFIDRDLRGVY